MNPQIQTRDAFAQLLGVIRAEYLWFHAAHHFSSGPPFFGDHKFYSKVYETYIETFDKIAERAMLYHHDTVVAPDVSTRLALDVLASMPPVQGDSNAIANAAAAVTRRFLQELQTARNSFRQASTLSAGLDNLLCQLSDDTEGTLYQLRQRCRN